jgi:hypothetical protein
MSDSEVQLRARLTAALDDFSPGPLPLDSVVRQGRTVQVRRRVSAIVAVLLVAAVALSAPALARQFGRQAPVTPGRYHVTVRPPSPRGPRGLIAKGTLNGRPWSVSGYQPPSDRPADACFEATRTTCGGVVTPRSAAKTIPFSPMYFYTVYKYDTRPVPIIAFVRPDVRLVRVKLSNGQTLTLRPVAAFGRQYLSWVAVDVPVAADVTQVRAYSAARLIAYAIPFVHGSYFQTVRWLRPGQAASPKPATDQIGEGVAAGQRWALFAHGGPWGTCLVGLDSHIACHKADLGGLGEGKPATLLDTATGAHGTNFGVIALSSLATDLRLTDADRKDNVKVTYLVLDGVRFASFTSAREDPVTRWAAYSAAGARLASGSIG